MGKIIKLFLMAFVILIARESAAKPKHVDYVSNETIDCSDNNLPNGVSRHHNEFYFCPFPNMVQCQQEMNGDLPKMHPNGTPFKAWFSDTCVQKLCPGFDYNYWDESRMDIYAERPADRKKSCWKWTCKSGYTFVDNKCLTGTELELLDMGSWCSSALSATYDPAVHTLTKSGNCVTYKCQSGCFESATNRTCVRIDANGTFGGLYSDVAGVCQRCSANEYVNGTSCAAGTTVDMQVMRNCFNCIESASYKACIDSGGAPNAQCNSDNTMTNIGSGPSSVSSFGY